MYSPWIDENDTLQIDGTRSISKTKSITGKIPQARFQHAAVCANDSIFVIGGTNGKTFFEDMYMYEPEKHHWTCFKAHEGRNEAKDCGRARHSVLLYEGSLYLFGGICKHGFTTNKLFRLDLQKDLQVPTGSDGMSDQDQHGTFSWRKVSPHSKKAAPSSRFNHASTIFRNYMYVFAGEGRDRQLSDDLYSFNFKTSEWRKELDYADQMHMKPPPGKEYKLVALSKCLLLFSNNLSSLHRLVCDSQGHALHWDKISTRGKIQDHPLS